MRRGQGHYVGAPGADDRFRHVELKLPYHREPVPAGGEVVCPLYLQGLIDSADASPR